MHSFPIDFIEYVTNDSHLGESLLDALNTQSPISIRKNPLKLSFSFENEELISWCEHAYYLKERPIFTLDPLFHAGVYYSQEAGSMLLDYVLHKLVLPTAPKVLDLCAAPGGKSTLIASKLNNNGLLVSNEVINQRAKILKENCSKWGYENVVVTNNDPSDFKRLPNFFDLVVVDAPCSGEGMFRKDLQAREEWSTDAVNLCASRQKRIVADVWDSIAENGYLIYSTCTFNSFENEENIKWITTNFDAEIISIDAPYDFVQGRDGIGIYGVPGRSKTEGFFIAVLQKKASDGSNAKLGRNSNKGLTQFKDLSAIANWVETDTTTFYLWNENVLAVPAAFNHEFLLLQDNLHLVKWGVEVGELARKGLIPSHDLLMCPSLRKEIHPFEITREQALKYLHGDTFTIEGLKELGMIQLTYQNEPIGWIKNIGNRFNNLYPKEYRIRMNIHLIHDKN
ncbi:MAG: hypothetical protein M9916_10375 [Crocinitomicaceae bacterium]|nr:hypothetical protein [Crocinitomicaceae bacterium]